MALIDDVFTDLRLQGVVFSRMTLRGDWGYAKSQLQGAPFHLVVSGEAWVLTGPQAEPRRLGEGDVAVLSHGDAHVLLSAPGARTRPWSEVIAREGLGHWSPGVRFKTCDLVLGEGAPETVLISGVFAFHDPRPNPLLEALPAIMVATSDADLQALAGLLDREIRTRAPGAEGVGGKLADLLLAQVVRRQLASSDTPLGWLKGLADPEISRALSAIHRTPERRWSVELLAREAGMSRSRFAARFRAANRPGAARLPDPAPDVPRRRRSGDAPHSARRAGGGGGLRIRGRLQQGLPALVRARPDRLPASAYADRAGRSHGPLRRSLSDGSGGFGLALTLTTGLTMKERRYAPDRPTR